MVIWINQDNKFIKNYSPPEGYIEFLDNGEIYLMYANSRKVKVLIENDDLSR